MLDPASGPLDQNSPEALEGRDIVEDFYSLSDVSPHDLDSRQKSRMRSYFDASSFAFNWFIFNHHDLIQEIHGEICALLDVWGWVELEGGSWTLTPDDNAKILNDYRRLMVMVPREYFKTSVCTKANALHQITKHPDLPVGMFGERLDNAKKWLRAIREVVENSLLFQVLYRDLLPPGIHPQDNRSMPRSWAWSDEKLQFQRGVIGIPEVSIQCYGTGAATAGAHFPTIIKDDLISEDAAKSPVMMEDAKRWFDHSLYLERPALKGKDLLACTSWAYGDLYQYILANYNYMLYRRAALENAEGEPDMTGKSIFPQKLSRKDLLQHHRRDPAGFACQMMNIPRSGGAEAFPPRHNRYFTLIDRDGELSARITDACFDASISEVEPAPQEVPLRFMNRWVILDPATARKSLTAAKAFAKNGLNAVGVDAFGRRFFFESQSFRTSNENTIKRALDLAIKWDCPIIGIEDVTFSEVYRDWMTYILTHESAYKPYLGYLSPLGMETGGVNKGLRVMAMQAPHEAGYYYFNKASTKPLLDELGEYPNGITVDVVDSAAYCDKYVHRPESPTEVEDRWWRDAERRQPALSGRDPMTGY